VKGVILHGGHGTRLRPLTHTGPKQLIPIANKSISQYVLEDIREAGVEDVAIVLGDVYPEKVMEHYGDGARFHVRITYIPQGEPKGIAHAIGMCRAFVGGDPFIVYLGDNLLKGGVKQLSRDFEQSPHDAMILLCEVKDPTRFGVAGFDEGGRLKTLVEKPKKPPSKYALTGVYFFKPIIFEMIKELKPSWRDELEITEAIQHLIDKGYNVNHAFVKGWWKDTGTPEDILDANRLVLDGLIAINEGSVEEIGSIQGRVSLGKGSVVKRGAVIRGPAVVGEETTIQGDVYIGPYTSIGDHVTVKRGEIENSIIMDHCLIDVEDRITDSIIGSHSKIITGADKPRGKRLVVGESSSVVF